MTQKGNFASKAGHAQIKIEPVPQGPAEFRSMYGLAGCTIDRLVYNQPIFFFPERSVPLAIVSNTGHCILPSGKAPWWKNTIAQWEWFPHPHQNVWIGKSFFCSTSWLNKKDEFCMARIKIMLLNWFKGCSLKSRQNQAEIHGVTGQRTRGARCTTPCTKAFTKEWEASSLYPSVMVDLARI